MVEQKSGEETYAAYWERLSSLHPTEVSGKTETVYRYDRKGYEVPFLNTRYLVIPDERRILRITREQSLVSEPLSMDFYLMSLVYLTEAKEVEPTRRWLSEKDLQGGEMFFRGPHALRVDEVNGSYGQDPARFALTGRRLGGVEMLYGDAAFGLDVFPKILLVYILWKGDEEFPSRVQVLFDETITQHFPLDVVWCTVSEVSRRLLALSD
jgi:hypothetical protein